MRWLILVVVAAVALAACTTGGDSNGGAATPTPSSSSSTATLSTDPLDQMVLAFDGDHSREEIRSLVTRVLRLYGLSPTDENYSRGGSVLVSMKNEVGVAEMDILREMITIAPSLPGVSFPEAAALATVSLTAG